MSLSLLKVLTKYSVLRYYRYMCIQYSGEHAFPTCADSSTTDGPPSCT